MADSSSLFSAATSQRHLLDDDDDNSSLKTERPASVYTAATVGGSGAEDDALLQPFDPPLGIFPHRRYVRGEVTVLEYAEAKSSISGADVVIRDVRRDRPVFVRHAPPIFKALMSNKEFRDASTGEPVLDLKMTWEATSGRTVMSGKDAAGEEILRFKSKTVLIKARLKTTFVNRLSGSNEEVVLNTAGGFTGKKDARIELGDTGRAVAIIRRASTWSAGAWLLINGQFHVSVAPGVDLALIIACCNAFDETRFWG